MSAKRWNNNAVNLCHRCYRCQPVFKYNGKLYFFPTFLVANLWRDTIYEHYHSECNWMWNPCLVCQQQICVSPLQTFIMYTFFSKCISSNSLSVPVILPKGTLCNPSIQFCYECYFWNPHAPCCVNTSFQMCIFLVNMLSSLKPI